MSEIGEVMDELIEMGFEHELKSKKFNLNSLVSLYNEQYHHIIFWHEGVGVRGEWIEYKANWEQQLFDKLKELGNE